jgi:hypothetical protein
MTGKTAKGKTEGEDEPVRRAVARRLFPPAAADDQVFEVIGRAQRAGQPVEVTLAHHWTDPVTRENHGPKDEVTVDADTGAGLAGAGMLLRGAKVRTAHPADGASKTPAAEGAKDSAKAGKDGKDTDGK